MNRRGPKAATHQNCNRCLKLLPVASFEMRKANKRRTVCENCRAIALAKRKVRMGRYPVKVGPMTPGMKWNVRKYGQQHVVYTHPLPTYGEVVTRTLQRHFTGKTLDELRDLGYAVEEAA